MLPSIKVVIGANYGDEGKGITTNYICKNTKGRALNVLFNGGMQRGHTVNDFVFHCFGSGSFCNADTYYDRNFMINPIAWVQELYSLEQKMIDVGSNIGNIHYFAHKDCPITIPYDIELNRAIEDKRGVSRHGSCGMGIYETFKRNQLDEYKITFSDLSNPLRLYKKLQLIKNEYFNLRKFNLGLNNLNFDSLSIDDFIKCSMKIYKDIRCVDSIDSVLNVDINASDIHYSSVVFEAGQGLLLDAGRIDESIHLTPSYTGLTNIKDWLNSLNDIADVEVIYVTRSYITRHGNGNLQFESNISELGISDRDKTNTHNKYQGDIRYGYLDVSAMLNTIDKDFSQLEIPANKSLSVTWLDKTGNLIKSNNGDLSLDGLTDKFYKVYTDCYSSNNFEYLHTNSSDLL